MPNKQCTVVFRVRYSETDQMGTFYNAKALDWFEYGRTEFLRSIGTPYAEMEAKGIFLPVVEAHVNYLGRARYDDELRMTTTGIMEGRARIRCMVKIVHASNGKGVAEGYTIHAFTNHEGRPIRPPQWFVQMIDGLE